MLGVFDGQNHVVTGLKIDRSQGECQGLFGCVNSQDANRKAQVKNVIVKDAQIRTKNKSGAVVGFYGGWASQMEPLENCAMVGGSIEGCVDRAGYDQPLTSAAWLASAMRTCVFVIPRVR